MTTPIPILQLIERRGRIGTIIRDVLSQRGIEAQFDERELHVQSAYVVEPTSCRTLSVAILEHMFPVVSGPVELFHYTSVEGLTGIAQSGELRLFSLRRRIDQGELSEFAQRHGLNGYLQSAQGEPFYRRLSDDLFYASFARTTAKNSSHMWYSFGKGEGARLRIKLLAKHAELRSIQYDDPSRTLLQSVNEGLTAVGEPPFVPWTVSKIGAFYLPSSLRFEDEVRLMVKRHRGATLRVGTESGNEFLPVKISTPNEFCHVEVEEVAFGPNADRAALKAALIGTCLESVPIG
jgi:hypothetical protein